MDHQLVELVWSDSWHDEAESTASDWRSDYEVRTVGYIVRDGDVVSIAQEVFPDGEGFRSVTHVPRALVRRVNALEPRAPVPAV
ncbi:MAG: hypothetical protein WD739_07320 [Actinomycetota bacterium]